MNEMEETSAAEETGAEETKGKKGGKKPKKEKKPKVKKEKKPKKEKKKKENGEGEEGEAGKKKGGKKKLLMILLPAVLLLAGAAVFLVTRVFGRMPEAEELPPEETEEIVETEAPEDPEETEAPGETEAPEPTQPLEIRTGMTTAEVIDFIRKLPPAVLGLPGEDMSEYELFASESVILIDGRMCTQVKVYSDDGAAGTNDIEGIFYLSRDSRRTVYRYDAVSGTVTELSLSSDTNTN